MSKNKSSQSGAISSLVLGTAQLGMPYGISNKTGQPVQNMATTIIKEAWNSSIRDFDTAQGYGTSEQVLGKAFNSLGISDSVNVITKFDPKLDHLNAESLSLALDKSLQRLGVSSLYGIFLHREELLNLWDKGLAEVLNSFVLSGKVKHIGVSVYSPEKAIQALNTDDIDMVQLPTNILDRRFETAGVFRLAEEKRKKIYIRSIFLQGLLLMDIKEIPEKMLFAKPVLEKLESLCQDVGLLRQEIALGYLKAEMKNSKIVFGADNPQHVKENLACWKRGLSPSLISRIKGLFNNIGEKILNPALWPN